MIKKKKKVGEEPVILNLPLYECHEFLFKSINRMVFVQD